MRYVQSISRYDAAGRRACWVNFIRRFRQEEDGGLIVLTLLLLVVMLVLGGMAVDFMRFESRRVALQSVADRAVLAAAELDQDLAPADVVVDYFDKAGFDGTIIGTPGVVDVVGSRSVSVESSLNLNTFYLRLIGIDELDAPAAAQAIEGAGNIEISLVLDISGSMNDKVDGTGGKRKYELLREAASGFVEDLLQPEYKDQVSISLVTYSANVSIGDELFAALNTGPTLLEDLDRRGRVVASFDNPARCVDFEPWEYETTVFNTSREYEQVEYFDYYTNERYSGVLEPSCPKESYEGIIPLSQNATTLTDAIKELSPRTYTAIHMGAKWGVSLLDPSMRDLLSGVPSVDAAFAGSRPSEYIAPENEATTVKYLVLMTDGENVAGRRLNANRYNTAAERLQWGNDNFNHWARYRNNTRLNDYTHTGYTANQADQRLQAICKQARDANITVFTIAMGATGHGEDEMEECASPGRYYETEGKALDTIFGQIADQITDLRLSL
ncbi:pilus assembly protein TadG-related protein [Loktanella agnita]|uniref:pilus assembly protein TadG-related protein n=1 Tax=Loktanella agnita TaxID=287097 RepID=UPI00398724D8